MLRAFDRMRTRRAGNLHARRSPRLRRAGDIEQSLRSEDDRESRARDLGAPPRLDQASASETERYQAASRMEDSLTGPRQPPPARRAPRKR